MTRTHHHRLTCVLLLLVRRWQKGAIRLTIRTISGQTTHEDLQARFNTSDPVRAVADFVRGAFSVSEASAIRAMEITMGNMPVDQNETFEVQDIQDGAT